MNKPGNAGKAGTEQTQACSGDVLARQPLRPAERVTPPHFTAEDYEVAISLAGRAAIDGHPYFYDGIAFAALRIAANVMRRGAIGTALSEKIVYLLDDGDGMARRDGDQLHLGATHLSFNVVAVESAIRAALTRESP